ncbi:hypothetical protein RB2654_09554 [Rhodobacterales bacterium HTCC2654]|uniref:Uncharacterized protein n=2 Tax=Maritimibacter TaxID=404235 RepID=A3VEG7_9RHOB|nr:hypothetical protein RB2654_09554 [Rhodobacterales bacterium HTCC2654] [Maritimibacter alkaliphilus HTCC2654]
MPAFGDLLSEEAVLDILEFIRSTWPREVQEVQSHRSHVTV